MSHLSVATAETLAPALPVWNDIPILYEDEGFEEMGDANLHTKSDEILHVCLCFHVQEHDATLQVFRNMNQRVQEELNRLRKKKPKKKD